MFTGIIEEIGEVKNISSNARSKCIEIKAQKILKGLKIGESVNINGACQTIVDLKKTSFVVQAVEETLKRTNLGLLKRVDRVNLERAMRLADRLGGHLLSGHVDCITQIKSIGSREDGSIFEFSMPDGFYNLAVNKGSIAVDGISLTIAGLRGDSFRVSVIPFTLKMTTLKEKHVGDMVNLEFDLLGKYVKRIIEKRGSKITEEWLREIL